MATRISNYFQVGPRHFSYAGTAFWLRFHGILVTLPRVNPLAARELGAAPVVPCICPCRKKPVVGKRKLWKDIPEAITAAACCARRRTPSGVAGGGREEKARAHRLAVDTPTPYGLRASPDSRLRL